MNNKKIVLDSVVELWKGPSFHYSTAVYGEKQEFCLVEGSSKSESLLSITSQRLRQAFQAAPPRPPIQAIVPFAIEERESSPLLIYKMPPGKLLTNFCGKPQPIGKILAVSQAIVVALEGIFKSGCAIGFLSPARIWFDQKDSTARLCGIFANSSDAKMKTMNVEAMTEPECWPYLAPESFGSSPVMADLRSHFYSLGMIIYELLSGKPAFKPETLLECSHAHMALPIPEITSVNVPRQLRKFLDKLLTRKLDDRYQSFEGILSDLYRMSESWRSHSSLPEFDLGTDESDRKLKFCEELIERTSETAVAQQWLQKNQDRRNCRILMVSGASGVGKTEFVQHQLFPLFGQNFLLVKCKFDQTCLEQPGLSFVQIAEGICRELFGGDETQIEFWKNRFKSALGGNFQLITKNVKSLEAIFSQKEAEEEIDPTELRKRTCLAWRSFLNACSTRENSLVLFVDDLQWIDNLSLDILSEIVLNQEESEAGMTLLLSFRDQELEKNPRLAGLIQEIRQDQNLGFEINMHPLSQAGIAELLKKSALVDDAEIEQVSNLLHLRTAGNPFFLRHFLQKLNSDGLLKRMESGWQWNKRAIESMSCSINVVDLLCQNLANLPKEIRQILEIAACIGFEFNASLLSLVLDYEPVVIEVSLRQLQRLGYLIEESRGNFRFSHDRVQQAASMLISETDGNRFFIAVAKAMVKEYKDSVCSVFQAASHLLRPEVLPESHEECQEWIEMLFMAAKSARASGAPKATASYCKGALNFLAGFSDQARNRSLQRELQLLLGEAFYLAGDAELATGVLKGLVETGTSFLEKSAASCLLCKIAITQGEMSRAVEIGFNTLFELSPELNRDYYSADISHWFQVIDAARNGRELSQLVNLPDMKDQQMQAQIDIMASMILPAQFFEQHLMHGLIAHMVELTLKHGLARESAYAFIWWGMVLVDRRNARYEDGYAYGRAGYDLVVSRKFGGLFTKACLFFGDIVNFYKNPLRSDRKFLDDAFKKGIENGDLIHSCYSCNHILTNMLVAGDPLEEVWKESERLIEFVREAGDENIECILISQRQFVLAMQKKTYAPGKFDSKDFSEKDFEERISKSQMELMILWYYIWKMAASYLAGQYDEAYEVLQKAERIEYSDRWNMEITVYIFFRGLILAKIARKTAPGPELDQLVAGIDDSLKHLQDWSDSCPANFKVRWAMVAAEKACLKGDQIEAGRLFEMAVHEARVQNFPNFEAMACELAAQMFREQRLVLVADTYEKGAAKAYRAWGAKAKFRFEDLPEISQSAAAIELSLAELARLDEKSSGGSPLLPLIAMLARASRLIIFSIENGEPIPVSAWQADSGHFDAEVDRLQFPESIIQFVARTDEKFASGTCPPDGFAKDPFWNNAKVESVACLPLIGGAGLRGLAYFENSFAKDAFALERLFWPEILCVQVFALLENARLLKQAQTARENLSLAIQGASLGKWEWNMATDEVTLDQRCFQMLGYDPNEFAPSYQWWFQSLHEEDREEALRQIQAHIDGKTDHYQTNFRLRNKFADFRHILALGKVVEFDSNGKPKRMSGFHIDMTEQHRLTERLRQSEKLEAVGQLAGGVAHDFNNLLQVISGCIELLCFKGYVPNDLQLIKDIGHAAKRGSDLTQQLLLFSRKKPAKFGLLQLEELVKNTLGLIRRLIGDNISLKSEIGNISLPVLADAAQVELILVNLCLNARDAMPQGGDLTIELEQFIPEEGFVSKNDWASHDRYAILRVIDNGTGIDAKDLPRIFEPFFTTKEPGKGTGLGMASAFGVVKQHSGHIEVESQPGKGTCFTVYLPLSEEKVEKAEDATTIDVQAGNRLVLLAEDDPFVVSTAKAILENFGFKTIVAEDGEIACRLFEENKASIDLVISDMMMPKVTGYQFYQKVTETDKKVPFLFISGYPEGSIPYAEIQNQGLNFIQKPFGVKALIQKINEILGLGSVG